MTGTLNAALATLADTLLRASLDGALLAGIVFLLSRPLRQRMPVASVFLWRLVILKFALGLMGVGVALGPPNRSSSSGASASGDPLIYCIGGALILGLVLGGERLIGEVRFLLRLRREATIPSQEWNESWVRVCRMQGISRPPHLLASETVELPLATGILHPLVVIPAQLILDREDRERVLAHELAHIRHGDLWFGWLVALLEPVFFFHPLFWLARRELRLAQEMAADRRVLHIVPGNAVGYARLLIALSRRAPETGAVALSIGEGFQALRQRLDAMSASRRRTDAFRTLLTITIVLGLSALSLARRPAMPTSAPLPVRAAAAMIAAPAAMAPGR
jgi:beta-lactamase regulating signal transducer with metallopeptidase domain